jgi:hypothetical protein
MKGKLVKINNIWHISHLEENKQETHYPLHPDELYEIDEWEQVFDNIEARLIGREVEFELEDFWETGLEEVIKVAKLK